MSPPADEHERLLIEGKKRLERSVSIPMLAYAAPFCLHCHAHQGEKNQGERFLNLGGSSSHQHEPMNFVQPSAEEDKDMLTADIHLLHVQIPCEKGQEGCRQDICICICIGGDP